MSKKTFLKGAAVLGVAGLLVQVMGAIFRIPLGNIIGDEGMGYYQTAYPIYIFLLIFSTNGAPAAISKMVSERVALGKYSEAHRVFKLSFILMTIIGFVAWAIIYFGANLIIKLTGAAPASYYAIVAIAPALLFVPIMAVYRGYFQGMQEMGPTATSQLIEQAIRVAVGLTLAFILLPKGIEYAAAGATFGATIGPIVGVLILILIYFKRKRKLFENIRIDQTQGRESAGSILKTLAIIAVPITIGVSIQPIMNLGDVAFVMRRLQDAGGVTGEEANALYGQLTGMAAPVINVPMALALSMALSMVPAIAAAVSTKDIEFLNINVRLGLRTAMIIGVPCSFGLMALSEPIMRLLYPLQIESAVSAASCLFVLSAGILFLCIAQTMAGVLQGLGKLGIAVWGIVGGFAVKCIATHFLTGMDTLGVVGAAIGTVLGYITIALINFIAVKKLTKVKFNIQLCVVKPFVSGFVMLVLVLLTYKLCYSIIGNSLSCLLAIGVGVIAYCVMLLKLKAISGDEIELLPKGAKLAKLFRKCRLI